MCKMENTSLIEACGLAPNFLMSQDVLTRVVVLIVADQFLYLQITHTTWADINSQVLWELITKPGFKLTSHEVKNDTRIK